MAKIDQLVHLDMNNNQIQNVSFQTLAVPPVTTNLPIGWFYWNTADKTAYAWTGTEWKDLGANYVHPSYAGTGQPQTALTGAKVISKINLENGHVTDVEERTLTPANIGAADASHTHTTANITALTDYTLGTDTPIVATDSLNTALGKLQKQIDNKTNNTGTVTSVDATVPTGLTVSGGPITESGTLNFAYASGYQGYTTAEANKLAGIAENANNYVLPTASASVLGGVKVGANLTIDGNGVLNASFTETDPVYTASIPNQMMHKGQISADSDLNNYTETGIFVCESNTNAATILNSPTTIGFLLEVVRNGSSLLYQKLQVQSTGKIYTRSMRTNWTAWYEQASSSDLANYIPTTHVANGITAANITNWNTAFGWGNYRDWGLGANAIDVANSNQIGLSGRFYKMEGSATGNTLGTGGFLNIPNSATSSMILKLNNVEASVGSLDANGVMTKRYDLWNSLNLTAGSLASLNTVGETVDKIWSSKNLNDWLNSKNYASASQLANYIPTSHVVNNITATDIGNWNAAYGWGTHIGKYLSLTGGTVNGNVRLNSAATSSVPASGSVITSHALTIGATAYGMQFGTLGNGQGYIQQTRTDGTATNYILNLNPNGGQVKVGSGGFESGGTIKFSGLGAGFVKSSADGTLSVDNTSYVTSAELGNRIPYTGADKAIDFGTQMITHNGIERTSYSSSSPLFRATVGDPSTTNNILYLNIENVPEAGIKQYVIEVTVCAGNGSSSSQKLVKLILANISSANVLTVDVDEFTEVTSVGTAKVSIGTLQKVSNSIYRIPVIRVSSSVAVIASVNIFSSTTANIQPLTFTSSTNSDPLVTGVAPTNTKDNYIGVDNEQLTLSGNKKTTGQWTFNNSVNIGTDTSEAQLTIKGVGTINQYKQSVLTNASSQKLWSGVVTDTVGSYMMNNAYYDTSNQYKPNYTTASGIQLRPDGAINFVANTGLTEGTNYTPTSRLRIGNDGVITASNLAGTGNRMVVASSTGVLSTQTIPSAQVLSLGTGPGQINLSGEGGSVQINTLATVLRQDSNQRGAGFTPYVTNSSETNYPTGGTGVGIRLDRVSAPNSSGIDIYSPGGGANAGLLHYKSFSGTNTESAWKIVADREWVTAENFLKTVNLGYTASATNGTITNTGGTNSTIPAATSSMAGLMLPAEKTKLNNIEANANNYLHPTNNPGTHPFATELTSGVQVLSQLVVNNEGHVVTVKGRNLTAADLASVMIADASNTATNQTWSASKIYTEVQAAINQAQTGALQYKGDYNPSTNTPAITTDTTVKTGFTYVVTATGTFAGQAVEAGDMIIAKINNPGSTAANWQIVNKNIPAIVSASTTVEGIIQLATNAEAIAGTNATKAITPATLKAAMDAAVGGFSIAFGNGSSINFDITHGLNTQFVTVAIYRASDMRQVIMQVAPTSASVVNIQCNTAPTNNQYIVVIKK